MAPTKTEIRLRVEEAEGTGEYPGGSGQACGDVRYLLEENDQAFGEQEYLSKFSERWVNTNLTWGGVFAFFYGFAIGGSAWAEDVYDPQSGIIGRVLVFFVIAVLLLWGAVSEEKNFRESLMARYEGLRLTPNINLVAGLFTIAGYSFMSYVFANYAFSIS